MSAPQMTAREWGLLILLSFLWGGAFFFAAVALKEVTPHALVFFRMVIASLALGVAGLAMGVTFPRELAVWRRVAVLGLFSTAMPFMLLYWAQTHIASGLAAILNAMTPIFTILVAHLFTRDEKIDARRLIGVLAGVAGVAVIVGPSAVSHLARGNLLAEAAVLGAAFCYAVASVYGRRFQTQSPIVLSFGQMVAGSVSVACHADCRRAVSGGDAKPRHDRRRPRPRHRQHRACLRHLLLHSPPGRRHQCRAGDAARAG
jgi:drug/metabolite transporter (DMT)-like permease